tara:strand:+ start:83 stop:301 length:219 start_codon:yes stop_codon:yes gene_type:complete
MCGYGITVIDQTGSASIAQLLQCCTPTFHQTNGIKQSKIITQHPLVNGNKLVKASISIRYFTDAQEKNWHVR